MFGEVVEPLLDGGEVGLVERGEGVVSVDDNKTESSGVEGNYDGVLKE